LLFIIGKIKFAFVNGSLLAQLKVPVGLHAES